MKFIDAAHSLEFDNHDVFYDHVEAVFADWVTLVCDRNLNFGPCLQTPEVKFSKKGVFVNRFEETGPEDVVDLHGGPDYFMG